MKNVYLKFHELKERKVHEDELGKLDLQELKYLYYDSPYYILKDNIFIGSVDKKENFAFLRQPDEDIYIDKKEIRSLMSNDIVLVELKKGEAYIKEILKRGLEIIIATVQRRRKSFKYFTDKPLFKNIVVGDESLVVDGSVVKLEVEHITEDKIYAKITEVIGHINDPDIDILKIVAYHNWPDPNMDELEKSVADIKIDYDYERVSRLDLKDKLVVTIDGKDAKDLDDGISLEVIDGKYHLGVHIADVSLYVKEDSLIDKEAYKKSTSVYMANRVIPMLPHKLSNDLCSLNPHEEKLTLSCLMVIDSNGKVVEYDIRKTIIESKYRLNYDDVNLLIEKNKSLGNEELDNLLLTMNELALKLTDVRKKRGELEFDSEEIKFVFNKDNKIVKVYPRKTGQAEELIESFMLAANETVAFHMEINEFPSIYRIHEKPDETKLDEALDKLGRLNVTYNKKAIRNSKELQKILKSVKGTEREFIVNMILLRSMQRAKYDKNPLGHFGLAARYYTHFTSPIRRYPDLILHRIIKKLVLAEDNSLKKFNYFDNILDDVAKHTSVQERVAIDIERDVIQLKSCEYLLDKIGEVFEGQIIQIMKSGIFVRLKNGIEGFVNMKNNYRNSTYDPVVLGYYANGKLYKMGDKIEVELISVDMIEREIDFIIYNKQQKGKKPNENNFKKQNRKL
ncbi:ribonuclease R [Haploplasma axanthum]|uniref:Ribonuclease R n=1 Tax=Haploplasma axanthum TaxID=29552 RepID=A0A449BDY8_HAPAX|nr:ribonuclease R [Haploplasma axanthum]VEU80656.1 exoribonuclease II [Haploplasma axanthum]